MEARRQMKAAMDTTNAHICLCRYTDTKTRTNISSCYPHSKIYDEGICLRRRNAFSITFNRYYNFINFCGPSTRKSHLLFSHLLWNRRLGGGGGEGGGGKKKQAQGWYKQSASWLAEECPTTELPPMSSPVIIFCSGLASSNAMHNAWWVCTAKNQAVLAEHSAFQMDLTFLRLLLSTISNPDFN